MTNFEILSITLLLFLIFAVLLVYEYRAYKNRLAVVFEPEAQKELLETGKIEIKSEVKQNWIDTRPPNSGSRFL